MENNNETKLNNLLKGFLVAGADIYYDDNNGRTSMSQSLIDNVFKQLLRRGETNTDLQFVQKAVNNHEALVEALTKMNNHFIHEKPLSDEELGDIFELSIKALKNLND